MEILAVGLDCKRAPVEIRERLSFVGPKLNEALGALVARPLIDEAVILSTCNRVEMYVSSEHKHRDELQVSLKRFLSEFHEVEEHLFSDLLYFHGGRAAANHLFEVASGIQSMVIGEAQIQGQVREAIDTARKHGSAGRVMDALFRSALSTGKRARTETSISENGVSVSFNAVELLKKKIGSLDGKVGMVIGSGSTARLTAQILIANGVSEIIIANRTLENGLLLAQLLNVPAENVYPLSHLEDALIRSDLVISSTNAPTYLVHHEMMKKVMATRHHRPVFLVDIAVPRDIEPDVTRVAGAHVWDIDDIKRLAEQSIERRKAEIHHVQKIVTEELEDFMAWMGALAVVPTITNLRRHADSIRRSELERVRHAFDDEKQLKVLEDLTNRIVNKLLHEPTLRLKEVASSRDAGRYAEVVQHLFSLQGVINEAN